MAVSLLSRSVLLCEMCAPRYDKQLHEDISDLGWANGPSPAIGCVFRDLLPEYGRRGPPL